VANELNLYFGPQLPLEFETVGLAFIAAPNLRSDSAIGILSALRYAQQNYDHIEALNLFDAGFSGADVEITYNSPNFSSLGGTVSGAYFGQGIITLSNEKWGPQVINNAIKVAGVRITPADTWAPIIQPGIVWRTGYVLAASGIEPSGSWLIRALDPDGNNDTDFHLTLIYSVPETIYSAVDTGDYGLNFPPSQARYKIMKEIAVPTSPHTIGYDGNLEILQSVKINGTVRASGSFIGTQVGSGDIFIKDLDKTLKQIVLRSSIAPDDIVELQYLSYNDYYTYSGFRDFNGTWWPFDANPEFGHIIGNDDNGLYELSSTALLNQVTLYAIPSAAIRYEFTENPVSGSTIGTLTLSAIRGIDYGETHFIRHLISSEPIEFIDARDGGTVINTYGHAVFARNFYDEGNQFGGDVFNLRVPSMMPLGRFVLGAPASVDSVAIADIRERGGGVPLDFPMTAVEAESGGLDKLRGFFDMGIWEGKAIKEGGVVEIQIDKSLLKTDIESTDPTTFLADEIYELVRNQVPPGIDFEIKYVENL